MTTIPQFLPKEPLYDFQPGTFVYYKSHQRKTALEPHWIEPYQVFLATNRAVKLQQVNI